MQSSSVVSRITVLRDGDRVRLRMCGEHDASNVGLVTTALAEAIALDGRDVAVDLSEVAFMGAATVGALVDAAAILAGQGRRLSVLSPGPSQRLLLGLCSLSDLIEHIAEDAERPHAPA